MNTKQEQRKYCIESRRHLSDEERKEFSSLICKKIKDMPCFNNAKLILSYMASFDEADPSEISDCIQKDKLFAYPVSYDNGIMKAYIPAKSDDSLLSGMKVGKYGIVSPDTDTAVLVNPEDIDLVIVPCVGFDENKGRLGHGKGYYDRYLPMCKKAEFICIAFEAQKLEKVCVDENDVLMKNIVTEKNIY